MEKNWTPGSKAFRDHLIITFPIMIVCWGLCVILGLNGITKADHAWINLPYVIGAFSTTIASYIALKKNGEVKGFKEWLKNVFDVKQSVWSYAAVIALVAVDTLVLCLSGGFTMAAPVYMIILMLPIMLIGGGLEEAGWRYITFPWLEKKFGFMPAALIMGLIWALWHLPLFFIPGVNQYGENFFAFIFGCIALSFMLGAIRKITGSVWLCVMMHMLTNAVPVSIGYDFYGVRAQLITMIVMAAVTTVWVTLAKKKRVCE
ncbi:MAG: CPBP family intramembrane metalloprotease [Oscillospiraceae bacterium]|nr:CPBP family intramembrane metalloprotease [Oscillospiraceae bacterium]